VAKVLIEQGGEFNHGYTYSGHPVACAVALANLELMERENLVGRVKDDIGPYLAKRFTELNNHPLVGVAETCGFAAGLVLVKNKQTKERFNSDLGVGMVCRGHCFGNGLIMRAPLTMTHAQIDELMTLIVKCLDLTYADAQKNGWLA
jgi:putrescine---pyruvate transaminase